MQLIINNEQLIISKTQLFTILWIDKNLILLTINTININHIKIILCKTKQV